MQEPKVGDRVKVTLGTKQHPGWQSGTVTAVSAVTQSARVQYDTDTGNGKDTWWIVWDKLTVIT